MRGLPVENVRQHTSVQAAAVVQAGEQVHRCDAGRGGGWQCGSTRSCKRLRGLPAEGLAAGAAGVVDTANQEEGRAGVWR